MVLEVWDLKKCKTTAKMEIVFGSNGIGVWPLISTWISPLPLGSNGLHCVERPHQCWVCVIFFACVCVGASDMTTASDDPSY
jgi:hypothetical protein